MAHLLALTDITDIIARQFVDANPTEVELYLCKSDEAMKDAAVRVGISPVSIPVDSNGRATSFTLREYGLSVLYRQLFSDCMFGGVGDNPDLDKYKAKTEFYTYQATKLLQQLTSAVILGRVSGGEQQVQSFRILRG